MESLEQMKQRICQLAEEYADWAFEISKEIFDHPEYSDKEYYSSRYLVEKMKEKDFHAEFPYLDLETAFRCRWGRGGAKVAFLAEYDALPGYGKNYDEMAHACGHNWIAASSALSALITAKLLEEKEAPGEVCYIGTPGEEETGRKVNMADAGAFDDLDGVFEMHLMRENCVDTVALAMTDFVFEFDGRSAHAAKAPERGVSALDACQLTIAGINALRQMLPPEVKIHVTYIDGGGRASIIPEHASLSVYVRDSSKDRLETIIQRLLNIGKGAELMTGAVFRYTRAENTYYDLKNDPHLKECMIQNLKKVGVTDLSKGDIYHAASSDIGNVSYRCPTCYCYLSMAHLSEADIHEDSFINVADSEGAHELLLKAAKAMAMTALDIFFGNKL